MTTLDFWWDMGPGDTSFQERSGLGAGPRKGEDPACLWPLVGSVVGVSQVPVGMAQALPGFLLPLRVYHGIVL